ncbi:MAG: hypothetical protein WBQ86_21520 [Candidatus Binatus sp.]
MAVATLHAESWRAHYRGAYRDGYLDGDVVQDRIRVWKERLSTPAPNQFVVLAEEDDDLIGFACAYGGHDETWGSLLTTSTSDPSTSGGALALRSWPRSQRGVARTTPAAVSTRGCWSRTARRSVSTNA